MMEQLLDALTLPFMQRAILAGIMLAAVTGYLGTFIVQRGLGFLGDGLAHAAFGGVALGLLLKTEPLWTAIPFTVAVALGIDWVKARSGLAGDTAVGVFFAVSVALGIVFLSFKEDYTADAFSYLFGSILAVSRGDVWAAGGLLLATLAMLPLWKRLSYATFDRELALTDAVPVRRDDAILSVFTAVAVVVAMKVLGIVLVSAFLIIPAATARLVAKTFSSMAVIACCIGVGTTIVGLFASYVGDVPSGAAIILTQAAGFFMALLAQGRR